MAEGLALRCNAINQARDRGLPEVRLRPGTLGGKVIDKRVRDGYFWDVWSRGEKNPGKARLAFRVGLASSPVRRRVRLRAGGAQGALPHAGLVRAEKQAGGRLRVSTDRGLLWAREAIRRGLGGVPLLVVY